MWNEISPSCGHIFPIKLEVSENSDSGPHCFLLTHSSVSFHTGQLTCLEPQPRKESLTYYIMYYYEDEEPLLNVDTSVENYEHPQIGVYLLLKIPVATTCK